MPITEPLAKWGLRKTVLGTSQFSAYTVLMMACSGSIRGFGRLYNRCGKEHVAPYLVR